MKEIFAGWGADFYEASENLRAFENEDDAKRFVTLLQGYQDEKPRLDTSDLDCEIGSKEFSREFDLWREKLADWEKRSPDTQTTVPTTIETTTVIDTQATVPTTIETETVIDTQTTVATTIETDTVVDTQVTQPTTIETDTVLDTQTTVATTIDTETVLDSQTVLDTTIETETVGTITVSEFTQTITVSEYVDTVTVTEYTETITQTGTVTETETFSAEAGADAEPALASALSANDLLAPQESLLDEPGTQGDAGTGGSDALSDSLLTQFDQATSNPLLKTKQQFFDKSDRKKGSRYNT